jgi:2,4-dienoyl-CoA reductase-like NADH-dependent reductase (Old Yellow Enzyme family)/thioredoxin reductase
MCSQKSAVINGLEHLLSPLKIKTMEIPNRVVIPPMGTGLGNKDGTVSEATLAYFRRRAQSGAGLIITEILSVHPSGSASPSALRIYDDTYIPGLRKLVDIAHTQGIKIAGQLHHAGRESMYQLKHDTAIAPSAIPSYIYGITPKEMSIEDIHEIVSSFGAAAARARKAGFDAVEIHAAHGYLLAQFLSANSNQRLDEYGGDLNKRARFIIDVLSEVRKQVGNDFPISLRISAEEFIKGGWTIEDMQTIVPLFVTAGADIIHASFGTHGSPGGITSAPVEYEQGFNSHLARKIKEVVDVPVIAVGRFTSPFRADGIIARGDADMVAFGRQTLADPDFLTNAREGHPKDSLECIACNQGCIERLIYEGKSLRCAINPETGQELLRPSQVAPVSRDVWIIGAGPGGLTAANEAARLGHKVSLFEENKEIGGQVRLAAQAPFKDAYGKWINVLSNRVKKLGVKIQTGRRVTAENILEGKPDLVILATGGENITPSIEGSNLPHVCTAWQILNNEVEVAEPVLIIGGGLTGMETADYISARGFKDITVIEALAQSPVPKARSHGYMLHKRLQKAGTKLLLDTRVIRIEPDAVIISNKDQQQKLAPIKQVIMAVGTKPRTELKDTLEKEGIPYTIIGDASKTGRIIEAVGDGAQAAWEIK